MQNIKKKIFKDCEDPNPLIRALAVRTMGCIRVDKVNFSKQGIFEMRVFRFTKLAGQIVSFR